MVAAAVVDPEFWQREWTTEPDGDEPSEVQQFEDIVRQVAKTPGAAELGHTESAILAEYDEWLAAMGSAASGESKMSTAKIDAARTMPAWKWWRAYCKAWPHLRWFAMRLTAHGVSASACERNWSTYEWIHNKKRNRLGLSRAEKLVRSFSNLNLLSRCAMYESGYVEWDVEMVFEEPEAEPRLPSRSSPHRAARPALGSQRPPPSRTVAQALMLPLALPVVQGTVVEAEAGLPRRAGSARITGSNRLRRH
jgi:hypothetical protein